MKVKFSREVKYIPEWNGNRELSEDEQFTATLIPLQMGDLVSLIDVINEFSSAEPGEEKSVELEKAVSILSRIEHLQNNIRLENLEDESGPVTPEDIVKFPRFMGLTMEIFNELAAISMPNEEDEKNSKGQPASVDTPTPEPKLPDAERFKEAEAST